MEDEVWDTIITPKNPVIKHGAYALTVTESGKFRMNLGSTVWSCEISLAALKDAIDNYVKEKDL